MEKPKQAEAVERDCPAAFHSARNDLHSAVIAIPACREKQSASRRNKTQQTEVAEEDCFASLVASPTLCGNY
ncbi:hypothetical protein B1H10_06145 [candidate division KSB1 bacterium 4484_188]|nr:MAG: hypothetical protein B1H10_06145 [candidate division KSB1 bacterium 4484_188]